MLRLILGHVLLATTLLGAQLLKAEPVSAITVSTRNMDFADPADRARLERRITRAAEKVCAVDGFFADVYVRAQQARCVSVARNEARAQMLAIEARRDPRFAML